ncbi:unnamed protein product, partial [Meganyctiphanes norvegica]
GDERVEEQPVLTSMHTVGLRLHNMIVDRLYRVSKEKDDEILFQEGRRIMGALLQLVTYREWLPLVLGQTAMKDWQLHLHDDGHQETYSPKVNPTIANVFS